MNNTSMSRVRSLDFPGHRFAMMHLGDVVELSYFLCDGDAAPVWAISTCGMVFHDNEIALYFDDPLRVTVDEVTQSLYPDEWKYALHQLAHRIAFERGKEG